MTAAELVTCTCGYEYWSDGYCPPCAAGNGHVDENPLDLLAGLRNGVWLDAQDFPPLRYAVPGVIPEGSTLLVGPPKIGKSWFVLAMALAVAQGGAVLGTIRVDPRPALYLALEDGHRRLQDRCRVLLEGAPIPPGFEYLTVVEPGMALATITAWMARHEGAEPVVILDTLGKVMPPTLAGESAYQRDYRVGSSIKRLADEHPGAALLVNHHDRKANSEDFVDSVSGTHGLAGAADTVIVLTRLRHESTGVLKVTGRDVPEGEYALRFDAGARWLLDGRDLAAAEAKAQQQRVTDGLDERSRAIVAYVTEHGDGVRASHVAEALGLDEDLAGRYLRRLAESHRLVRLSRGLFGLPVPLSEVSECPVAEVIPLPTTGQPDGPDTPIGGDSAS